MKKLFTVFCAVCLMPTFSAQAWIGGPFSNNSFFGENADDGVYEAAATAVNGIGLFRIVVANNFTGVNPTGVTTSLPVIVPLGAPAGTFTTSPAPIGSGNVVVGGLASRFTNIWFINGVFYGGFTFGTASSVMGIVQAMGESRDVLGTGPNFMSSQFTATFQGGRFIPARAFAGFGTASVVGPVPIATFPFTVFGSKVSSRILFGL